VKQREAEEQQEKMRELEELLKSQEAIHNSPQGMVSENDISGYLPTEEDVSSSDEGADEVPPSRRESRRMTFERATSFDTLEQQLRAAEQALANEKEGRSELQINMPPAPPGYHSQAEGETSGTSADAADEPIPEMDQQSFQTQLRIKDEQVRIWEEEVSLLRMEKARMESMLEEAQHQMSQSQGSLGVVKSDQGIGQAEVAGQPSLGDSREAFNLYSVMMLKAYVDSGAQSMPSGAAPVAKSFPEVITVGSLTPEVVLDTTKVWGGVMLSKMHERYEEHQIGQKGYNVAEEVEALKRMWLEVQQEEHDGSCHPEDGPMVMDPANGRLVYARSPMPTMRTCLKTIYPEMELEMKVCYNGQHMPYTELDPAAADEWKSKDQNQWYTRVVCLEHNMLYILEGRNARIPEDVVFCDDLVSDIQIGPQVSPAKGPEVRNSGVGGAMASLRRGRELWSMQAASCNGDDAEEGRKSGDSRTGSSMFHVQNRFNKERRVSFWLDFSGSEEATAKLVQAVKDSQSKRGSADKNATMPTWVRDEDGMACANCHQLFMWRRKRHHCRLCGQTFCRPCSNRRKQLPRKFMADDSDKAIRVCDDCADAVDRALQLAFDQ